MKLSVGAFGTDMAMERTRPVQYSPVQYLYMQFAFGVGVTLRIEPELRDSFNVSMVE
jgi:hypothetical protein